LRRFRWKRRRHAALALLPVTMLTVAGVAIAAPEVGEDPPPRISAAKADVRYGTHVVLRGVVPSADGGAAGSAGTGERARIEFRQAGQSSWRSVATAQLDGSGRYRLRLRARHSGAYRVVSADDAVSQGQRVRVTARVRARITRAHIRADKAAVVRGRVRPGGERRAIRVRIGGTAVRTTTNGSGRFDVRRRMGKPGRYRVRVRAAGNRSAAGAGTRAGRATVYRAAAATWYGPGLYGNRLACGGRLAPSTIGVAHKTFPCGSRLTLRVGKRSMRVRVIDRGPFVAGREFDLTAATKRRLGFGSVGTVWSSR